MSVGFRAVALAVFSFSAWRGAREQTCAGAPSEASDLSLSGAGTTQLTWLAPVDPGGTETVVYDVLRSTTANGFISGYCVASDVTDVSGSDAAAPAPILFYLVRAKNGCGSNLGTDSTNTPRSAAACQLCGDGIISNGETCDGNNFGGATCATVTGCPGGADCKPFGNLTCTPLCQIDPSNCTVASSCTSCADCGNQACNNGSCGACTLDSDCCQPFVCISGNCEVVLPP